MAKPKDKPKVTIQVDTKAITKHVDELVTREKQADNYMAIADKIIEYTDKIDKLQGYLNYDCPEIHSPLVRNAINALKTQLEAYLLANTINGSDEPKGV